MATYTGHNAPPWKSIPGKRSGAWLKGHVVVEAIERGSDRLANGEPIAAAETAGFELLLTTEEEAKEKDRVE